MASPKKHLHKCSYHPRIVAKGKCNKCGKWLCVECAVLYRGHHFCAETCTPIHTAPQKVSEVLKTEELKIESYTPIVQEIQPKVVQKKSSWRSIMTMASITLALCCIVLTLWAWRELTLTRQENVSLQEKRLHLITLLKSSNREIASLREKVFPSDSLKLVPTKLQISKQLSLPDLNQSFVLPEQKTIQGIPVTFNNGTQTKKLVAITFDAGSVANAAQDILDTLSSRHVKTTMFLTGDFIRKYPDIVRKIISEGHEIGNHTMSHPHLTTYAADHTQTPLPNVSPSFLANELVKADNLLLKVAGVHFAPFWRAPYGEFNETICKWALNCGYIHIGWRQGRTWRQSLDSNDWIPNEETPGYKNPQEVLDKIMSIAETKPYGINGGIILMHLGTERAKRDDQVHTILGTLIDRLNSEGYTIVNVSELVKESGVDLTRVPVVQNVNVTQ